MSLANWNGAIFLREIKEDVTEAEGVLKIQVDRSKVSNHLVPAIEVDDIVIEANPIEVDEELPIIAFEFTEYIAYSVLSESYTPYQEDEQYEGTLLRIYSKSKYLDFIRARTFAEAVFPDLKHYQIGCLNHIVDIISVEPPIVTEITR